MILKLEKNQDMYLKMLFWLVVILKKFDEKGKGCKAKTYPHKQFISTSYCLPKNSSQ